MSDQDQAAEALAGEWAAKVRRYTPLTQLQLKPNPKKASSPEVAVIAEGERVLKATAGQDYVVVLDERGRNLTSEGMADLLAQASERGASGLTFCIGGPFGHSPAVRQRGNDTIKLSSMVLNHQIANLVLLEQLYRGWTILRGEPYHH
ncbi:hypothetical protein WJX72_001104 [[Myrmecia] bisecta]|uniref:Ribosomal RNA large subunit methyltransferase H n=1 Tax=[Myrmecia] bisecta TaxID=41462 RepID=A0AAW1PF55_9CHLO